MRGEKEALSRKLTSLLARYFYLYAFGGGGLIGVADLLVRFLYDPRYVTVAHYLSILGISTALMMTTRSMECVEVAKGRPRTAVEMNIARLAWLIGGGALALVRSDPLTFVFTSAWSRSPPMPMPRGGSPASA